jgi:hypothetical protein
MTGAFPKQDNRPCYINNDLNPVIFAIIPMSDCEWSNPILAMSDPICQAV